MSKHDSSDEDLIRAVLSGHTDDFCILIGRHSQLLFGLVFRQVQERELAEEICQESFIKAFLGLRNFRYSAKFSTWLVRIGLNQVNKYFASRKYKERFQSESFDVKHHEIAETNTDEALSQERRLTHFALALGKLKPKFRDALVLCSLEGKSYEEAAEILGVPVGTIRSRLNSARLMVRDILAFDFKDDYES
jgi:RNA polymerase sigma-70 factor (ECF subfamily)